jgi:pilus assembly protein CpaB
MKIARLAMLGVALAAGGAAAFLVGGKAPPAPVMETAKAPPPVETDEILVTTKELMFGSLITEQDIVWQSWPKNNVPGGLIRKSDTPNALEDVKGSVVRGNFVQGEPLRKDRLVKGPNSGFMSAILPSGSRAVAINIDSQGATSAGGFILPNDRVDIVRTFRDEEASKSGSGDAFLTQTILSNVRVLAIGQNVQEKNGERVVVGSNATLELDPRQSEVVILAQRTGQLSLTLRSMLDSNAAAQAPLPEQKTDKGITIVRSGVPTQSRGK